MQKNLQQNFLAKVPLPTCVKGFCKETSYCDFLKEHRNQNNYMRIDIQNFFDSITEEQIRENLKDLVKTQEAITIITKLCTYEGFLPQGAVTSPMLSNIIFRRIDQRILKYCQKFDVIYTRYADDLLFSSNKIDFKKNKWFSKKVKYILRENGFKSNEAKKHIEEGKICLGGFVIENEISLSRNKLRNLNKITHYFKDKTKMDRYVVDKALIHESCLPGIAKLTIQDSRGKARIFHSIAELINYLCGYRAFLIEIIQANENPHPLKMKNLQNKIKQIEKIVYQFEIVYKQENKGEIN